MGVPFLRVYTRVVWVPIPCSVQDIWELGRGLALCFNGQCWFCISKAFLVFFFMVYLMGFVLFCFDVLKIYSGINASLELSSFPSILFFFPSILFEKPTHTVSQMFWSFGKHGVYNWEHLRCIISQMIVLCHFAWVFYFSCHLSPFSPPASFLRRKSPSMSGQTALSSSASKCWPSNPAPSSFAHWRHPPRLCKNPF